MSVQQPRRQHHGSPKFGRAAMSWWTVILLFTLRCYAIIAVAIAVYAFMTALH